MILMGVAIGLSTTCVFLLGYWWGFRDASKIAKEHIGKMADANLAVLKKVLEDGP